MGVVSKLRFISSSSGELPGGEYLAVDWSDGGTSVFPREVAVKYLAIYGRPDRRWRAATPAEAEECAGELARLEALNG